MAYTSARGDLGDRVGEVLLSWLPSRLASAGTTAFDISEFSAPPAGYSGNTVFFTANWTDAAGVPTPRIWCCAHRPTITSCSRCPTPRGRPK